jgi:glycerol kinase
MGLDQGTSATKCVLFDLSGAMVAAASHPLGSSYPQPGYVEQDPEGIVESALHAVERCLASLRAAGGSPGRVAACGISNQRETFLLWDQAGRPLTPAVVWQCKRSVEICQSLRAQGIEPELRARTGLLVDPYFSGTKVLWLLRNDRDLAVRARRGEVRFGTVDTWLLHRLTRGAAHATDYTNASRTLLFNLQDLRWDGVAIEALGARDLVLPVVHPSAYPYGETDFGGRLDRPIPIAAMAGDSHAAAFGQGCFHAGDAKATLGTGSSILMNVGSRRPEASRGLVATVCFSTADRVDYALEGIVVSCGATLVWLRDRLGLFAASSQTEAMARSVPDNGGVHVVPGFSGLGAPWWKADATGAIAGLTFGTRREHIVRAALESIPFQVRDVIGSMETDAAVHLSALRVDGAITSNTFVLQMLADLLGVQVVNMGIEQVSALGAARLAGLGAGLYRDLEEIECLERRPIVHVPGSGAKDARAWHDDWKKTVEKFL